MLDHGELSPDLPHLPWRRLLGAVVFPDAKTSFSPVRYTVGDLVGVTACHVAAAPGAWMLSAVGLLAQRELGARRRVDELREEADQIQAELAVAEREWQEWAIARSRVGEVLAPAEGPHPGRPPRASR
jgi:hypothetical protein